MTTYYVSTDGSNSDSGSAKSPWRTISYATKADLKPGDEVVVKSGTYNEAVIVNKDGKAGDSTSRSAPRSRAAPRSILPETSPAS